MLPNKREKFGGQQDVSNHYSKACVSMRSWGPSPQTQIPYCTQGCGTDTDRGANILILLGARELVDVAERVSLEACSC
jgi:hypothetical protein